MSRLSALVADLRSLTPTVIELTLVRTDGKIFPQFRPGQYATISFPAYPHLRGERSFSIASAPTNRKTLSFGIRTSGKFTTALRSLKPGDAATVAGPFGQFTFEPRRDSSVVFLAGGIGITPFMSMARTAADLKLTNQLTLFYSVRSLFDASYRAELDAIEKAHPNIRTVYAVTDDAIAKPSSRIVAGRITRELVAQTLDGDAWSHTFFVCGPPAFMAAMTDMLGSLGLPVSMIRMEKFSVGSSALIERGTRVPKYIFAAWGAAAAIVFGAVFRIEQGKRAAQPTATTIDTTRAVAVQNLLNTLQQQAAASAAQQQVTPVTQTPSGSTGASATTNTAPTQQQVQRVVPTPTPRPIRSVPIMPRTTVS